jgi:hypothetical protein
MTMMGYIIEVPMIIMIQITTVDKSATSHPMNKNKTEKNNIRRT